MDNRGEANLTRRAFGGSRVAVPSRPCSRRLRRRWRCADGWHRGAAVRCQLAPPPGLWGELDRHAQPVDTVSGDVGPVWIVAMAGAEFRRMTVPDHAHVIVEGPLPADQDVVTWRSRAAFDTPRPLAQRDRRGFTSGEAGRMH